MAWSGAVSAVAAHGTDCLAGAYFVSAPVLVPLMRAVVPSALDEAVVPSAHTGGLAAALSVLRGEGMVHSEKKWEEGMQMSFQQSFKALSDPIRREILALLRAGPMAAGDIASHFDVSGATISHHLSILRDAGLVLDDKQGKYIYYELNMSVLDEILEWITALKGGGQ